MTGAALGERFGVKVVIGGDVVCTNGETIYLAELDESNLNPNAVLGYLSHEAGHIRYSAFGLLKDLYPFEKTVFNCLEDARIEKLMSRKYPGVPYLLQEAHKPLFAEVVQAPERLFQNPGSLVASYSLYEAMGLGGIYASCPEVDYLRGLLEAKMVSIFGGELTSKIKAEVHNCTTAKNSKDIVEATKRIVALLQQEAQNAKPSDSPKSDNQLQQAEGQGTPTPDTSSAPNSSEAPKGDKDDRNEATDSGEGRGEAQGQDSNDQEDKDASGETDTDKSSKDSSDASQDEKGEAEGSKDQSRDKKGSNPSGNTGTEASSENSDPSQDGNSGNSDEHDGNVDSTSTFGGSSAAALTALNSGNNDFDDRSDLSKRYQEELTKNAQENLKEQLDSGATPLTYSPVDTGESDLIGCSEFDERVGELFVRESYATSTLCRRSLRSLIESAARTKRYRTRSGLRIDGSVLARAASFDTRVFEKKSEAKGVSTVVHLLVDNSGSMVDCWKTAITSTLSMAASLMNIKDVKVGITAFPGTNGRATTIVPQGAKSLARYKGPIGRIEPDGGTPLYEGLMKVAYQLSKAGERRKVIVVLTDGYPCNPLQVMALTKRLVASGVEIYAIGIGSETGVDGLFEKCVSISRIEELPEALFELGRQIGRQAVGA